MDYGIVCVYVYVWHEMDAPWISLFVLNSDFSALDYHYCIICIRFKMKMTKCNCFEML